MWSEIIMIHFPNTMLELWELIESEQKDVYNTPKQEYKLYGVFPCDFQAGKHVEYNEDFGEIIQDTFFAYLEPEVKVNHEMIARIVGKPDTYSIVGDPVYSTNFQYTSHLELTLTRHAQPEKLKNGGVE